jgi:hypothetical protein
MAIKVENSCGNTSFRSHSKCPGVCFPNCHKINPIALCHISYVRGLQINKESDTLNGIKYELQLKLLTLEHRETDYINQTITDNSK